jgi:hypothetical protein
VIGRRDGQRILRFEVVEEGARAQRSSTEVAA